MVRATLILFLLGGILLLTAGCNQEEGVTITAGIKNYSPLMSSTPGIPLTVNYGEEKTFENARYHWTTGYGQFLRWEKEVEPLGADVILSEDYVYWGVNFMEERDISQFEITVRIEDQKSRNILAEAKLILKKDQNGYFSTVSGIE